MPLTRKLGEIFKEPQGAEENTNKLVCVLFISFQQEHKKRAKHTNTQSHQSQSDKKKHGH